jgi:hypothetical protein
LDIAGLKANFADLLGQLFVYDVSTGTPVLTTNHIRANVNAPMSLADTDLPTWCIFTKAATYPNPPDQSDGRLAKETRDFDAILFVSLAQSGTDAEAEFRASPYVDYARDWIQSHIQLYQDKPPVPGIMRAYLIKDSGIIVRKYAPNDPVPYICIGYTVRVEGRNTVNYASQ